MLGLIRRIGLQTRDLQRDLIGCAELLQVRRSAGNGGLGGGDIAGRGRNRLRVNQLLSGQRLLGLLHGQFQIVGIQRAR